MSAMDFTWKHQAYENDYLKNKLESKHNKMQKNYSAK